MWKKETEEVGRRNLTSNEYIDFLKMNYEYLHNATWESHKQSWIMTGIFVPMVSTGTGILIRYFNEIKSEEQLLAALVLLTFVTWFWCGMIRCFTHWNSDRRAQLKILEDCFSSLLSMHPNTLINSLKFKQYRLFKHHAVSFGELTIILTAVETIFLLCLYFNRFQSNLSHLGWSYVILALIGIISLMIVLLKKPMIWLYVQFRSRWWCIKKHGLQVNVRLEHIGEIKPDRTALVLLPTKESLDTTDDIDFHPSIKAFILRHKLQTKGFEKQACESIKNPTKKINIPGVVYLTPLWHSDCHIALFSPEITLVSLIESLSKTSNFKHLVVPTLYHGNTGPVGEADLFEMLVSLNNLTDPEPTKSCNGSKCRPVICTILAPLTFDHKDISRIVKYARLKKVV